MRLRFRVLGSGSSGNATLVEAGETSGLRTLKVDPKVQEERARDVEALRARRSRAAAEGAIDALRRADEAGENLFPAVLGCVKADVTLGEICGALEARHGRYQPEQRA